MRRTIGLGGSIAAGGRLCVRRWPRQEEIAGQLSGFSGLLQVDGYAAYKSLAARSWQGDPLAFCLAHARRNFVEVYKTTKSPFAREVIERIAAVYAIESEFAARGRRASRSPSSRKQPLMEALEARLVAMRDGLSRTRR